MLFPVKLPTPDHIDQKDVYVLPSLSTKVLTLSVVTLILLKRRILGKKSLSNIKFANPIRMKHVKKK